MKVLKDDFQIQEHRSTVDSTSISVPRNIARLLKKLTDFERHLEEINGDSCSETLSGPSMVMYERHDGHHLLVKSEDDGAFYAQSWLEKNAGKGTYIVSGSVHSTVYTQSKWVQYSPRHSFYPAIAFRPQDVRKIMDIIPANGENRAFEMEQITARAKFEKAASPEKIVRILGFQKNALDRTPRELSAESQFARRLLASAEGRKVAAGGDVQAVEKIFKRVDPDAVIPHEQRRNLMKQAAQDFIAARGLGRTLEEIKPRL